MGKVRQRQQEIHLVACEEENEDGDPGENMDRAILESAVKEPEKMYGHKRGTAFIEGKGSGDRSTPGSTKPADQ
jgi:hypothetical protein